MSLIQRLKTLLGEAHDLDRAAALLDWDQLTYMPPGGSIARARQISLLKRLSHERLTALDLGNILEDLRQAETHSAYDSDEASLIRVARRDYEKNICIPASFMEEYQNHVSEACQVWAMARPANDFNAVAPYLEKMVNLTRRFADFFPGHQHIADPVIRYFTGEDVSVLQMRDLLHELKNQLVPMVQAIMAAPSPDDSFLYLHYPEKDQLAFGMEVMKHIGFDFERGREDKTIHPFCSSFSIGDIRVNTRVNAYDLREALFSTIHETGHGLYNQGFNPALEGLPLAEGASGGIHESQSRLWENNICRSLDFWSYYFPRLQETFPQNLSKVSIYQFCRAINKVHPTLVRVRADEVTYNLHILLRFELEIDLLERKIAVRDLPEVWRSRFKDLLGIEPVDVRDGVIQDIHWFGVPLGAGYLVYTLGNIYAAQIYEVALKTHPEIPEEITQGNCHKLHQWLIENIYTHGRKFTSKELIRRLTGGQMDVQPYLRYLRGKYSQLYGADIFDNLQ